MKQEHVSAEQEREYPHWQRVYLIVIVYTVVLIVGLWAFSRLFQ
ncbi:MAG: hypothetical protein U0X75_27920 [Acidobacteriota bacterium]